MSRKDTLKSFLVGGPEAEVPHSPSEEAGVAGLVRPRAANLRVKTGPILHLAADLQADKGEPIIEIEPALIDASFIRDRLDGFDGDHAELVESIRNHGQQVPVLLRPHPKDSARFQVVYGHRRVRACRTLEKPVRAVVRALTDAQLVVAQGQENSARKALSYIERAFFAVRLNESGFERDVIMAALNLSKSHLSTLMSVGRRIPAGVIEAIGPAPKAGEPRWVALADRLDAVDAKTVDGVITSASFNSADSDSRFIAMFEALQRKVERTKRQKEVWAAKGGPPLATFQQAKRKASLVVDEKAAPEFGRFLFAQLPELYREFLKNKGPSSGA
jgi:ParB family transcriptional regulator, chromosome partitioning protein